MAQTKDSNSNVILSGNGESHFSYTLREGGAVLTNISGRLTGALILPSALDGHPLTGIEDYGLGLTADIESVTIPEFVVRIGPAAFSHCDSLVWIDVDRNSTRFSSADGVLFDKTGTRLIRCPKGRAGVFVVPEGVTDIADHAFSGCSVLTAVILPVSVRSIGDRAFSCCAMIKAFTVATENRFFTSSEGSLLSKDGTELIQAPLGKSEKYTVLASVSKIAIDALRGRSTLTAVEVDASNESFSSFDGVLYDKGMTRIVQVPTGIRGTIRIPSSVTAVEGFSFCGDLDKVVIEYGVTDIAAAAFIHCKRLSSVIIPGSVSSIGSHAFAGCSRLANISIPDKVTRIEAGTFYKCRRLTTAVFGRCVVDIENFAFQNCGKLATLILPRGISRVGERTFSGCSSLKEIAIPDGVVEIASDAFSRCESLTAVTIPRGVVVIGNSAFQDCICLTEVTIPDSVVCIRESAFSGCISLLHVSFPKSIRRIEDWAFCDCTSLSEVEIPSGVTWLFSGTFFGCTSLLRISMPASLTRVGWYAFISNSSLTAIDVDEGNPLYRSVKGVLFDKHLTRLVRCPEGYAGCLFIPASVIRLSSWCCESCSQLTEIVVDAANPRYNSLEGVLYDKGQTVVMICPDGKAGRVVIPASTNR